MILYIKNGCPYCKKVLDFAAANGISFSQLKEKHEPGVLDELLSRGGKSQFPYLVDEKNNVEMYESEDIIRYLEKNKEKSLSNEELPGKELRTSDEEIESSSSKTCTISLE